MRKTVLLILSIFICTFSFAKKNKDYEKIIKKYDIIGLMKSKSGSPEDFWRQLENGHSGLLAYKSALVKGQKSALKAEVDISMALGVIDNQYQYLYVYTGDTIANYTRDIQSGLMGIDANRIRIHIAYGDTPNAFCTPRGDIYIYTSLLNRIDYDWRMLFGICAHEVSHYYLRHSARQKWADRKREKKNRWLAGIAIGLSAAADGMAAYNAGYAGQEYESHLGETCQSILASAQLDNQMYHFKYSREEELEADIIAYRFLEFVGIDPAFYIKALSSLGIYSDAFYSNWSDHPTISYRTNFLSYLGAKYPLNN